MKYPAFALCLLLTVPVIAQQNPPAAAPSQPQNCCEALQQQIKDLQERIITLEGEVRMLKQQSSQGAAAATPAPAPLGPQAAPQPIGTQAAGGAAGGLPTYGGASALAKALNPDISMIGDFLSSLGGNSIPRGASQTPISSFEMHESELGIQAIIDPYARGDFFLTFGEEGVALEEGYMTFTALPAGFVGRVGKMRAAFGKVNTLHNHMLPWADRPLVTDNLVGGEDGIDDAGISITRSFAGPKNIFLEATGQLFRGDSGTPTHPLFVASQKSDVAPVAHLRGYKDITESTNLDIGLSFARGHNEFGTNFLTKLYGVDATLRWKPLRRSIYHSFIARSEFVWSQRQQVTPSLVRSFGYYTSADYQLGRRWFIGGRFDSSDRAMLARADRGASLVLTYWPSEFSQIRSQYRFTHFVEGTTGSELLMQVQFVLGAHGAHPF
jgi:hypothetical protein